jgi:hypothetical protein
LGRIQDETSRRNKSKCETQELNEIDSALTSLISIIKQATQDATPTLKICLQNKTRNVPIEMKKLIVEKRRARARWHRSQAPTDKTTHNHISNRPKCKIKDERDLSLTI